MKSFTSWGITAPRFTSEDEKREKENLSSEERKEIRKSLYGKLAFLYASEKDVTVAGDWNHSEALEQIDVHGRLPDLVEELDAELEKIPSDQKEAILGAMEQCPEQVTNKDKEKFLRRVDLNPKLAAQRMVDYWERRRYLFGQERCYRPLTLNGALEGDRETMECGVCFVLPENDLSGRSIFYYDPSQLDWDRFTPDSLLRVMWYFLEIAGGKAEDGMNFVSVAFQRNAEIKDFKRKFLRQCLDLEKLYLPVRCHAIHVCHPNAFLGEIIAPIMKVFMGKRFRLFFQVHRGETDEVLQKLEKFGIQENILPIDLGGKSQFHVQDW
eukprot:CAMPEP_0118679772 /NCGR_PEP_ID=MMETSP0800-20121206/3971_1 /TAXON_ID=210618 ORGANISM="Striatella unipunctata, Strain CCMP2910" /NCGR_SAMPLE_ID=MMETSP0800 /ASSEMBLY_ACC=CAM_ASM_000638 /LENGTH=324 /DNA_ID=CAMNT_0006575799 /DNA_START=641 /DNA_END=1612 /DNA_ORIENTATION=-